MSQNLTELSLIELNRLLRGSDAATKTTTMVEMANRYLFKGKDILRADIPEAEHWTKQAQNSLGENPSPEAQIALGSLYADLFSETYKADYFNAAFKHLNSRAKPQNHDAMACFHLGRISLEMAFLLQQNDDRCAPPENVLNYYELTRMYLTQGLAATKQLPTDLRYQSGIMLSEMLKSGFFEQSDINSHALDFFINAFPDILKINLKHAHEGDTLSQVQTGFLYVMASECNFPLAPAINASQEGFSWLSKAMDSNYPLDGDTVEQIVSVVDALTMTGALNNARPYRPVSQTPRNTPGSAPAHAQCNRSDSHLRILKLP